MQWMYSCDAVKMRDNGVGLCPFCRTPTTYSEKELMKWTKKRVEVGDANAIFTLGCNFAEGSLGLPRNYAKALELYNWAGELGCADAYNNIGNAYYHGRGVERDERKADHYYELAAMQGSVYARHNIGIFEASAGNWDRAIKHYMIAAGGGLNNSVKNIQQLYRDGHATKEDYTKALLAYQKYLEEIRSDQRDKSAAFSDEFKCYVVVGTAKNLDDTKSYSDTYTLFM